MPKAADQMSGKVPAAAPAASAPKQPAPQKAAPPKQTTAPTASAKTARPPPQLNEDLAAVLDTGEGRRAGPSFQEFTQPAQGFLPVLPPSPEQQTLLYRDAMARARAAAPKAAAPPTIAEKLAGVASPSRVYAALTESAPELPRSMAAAGEAAREKYGTDLGLSRVAALAQEYLPGAGARQAETRTIRAPARAAGVGGARVSFPSDSAPRIGPDALKSVAEFRRYVETAAEDLAEAERIRSQLESKIAASRSSRTATDADRAKLADTVRKQNQYITDVRAGLVRAGMSDADIEALKMGEPPLPR